MTRARMNLVVLRVSDIDQSARFYQLLDLKFVKHAHGKGPEHYACEMEDFVFELYPTTPEQPISASTRIGFELDDVDASVAKLSTFPGARIVSPPKDSEWGRRAVIADPDGIRVEFVESQKC